MYYFLLRAESCICIDELYTESHSTVRACLSPLSVIPAWDLQSSEHVPTSMNHSKQPQQSGPCQSEILLMLKQRGDSHPILTSGGKNQIALTKKEKRKKRKSSSLCLSLISKSPCFSWFNIWTIYFCVKPPNYTPGAKWRSNPFTPSSLDNQHST